MRIAVSTLCLFLYAGAPAGAETPAPPPDAVARLAALEWLAGTWTGPSPQGMWEARYTSAGGGLMLSANKETKDGKVIGFEFEQFLVAGDQVVMQPYIGGVKSPASFPMTESDPAARRAVFENPGHDFPQIITYHRTSDSTLNIKVQARRDGQQRGFELNLTRTD